MKATIRLPKTIVPKEYNIELEPDLINFTFKGVEEIKLNLLKAARSITFHCKDIDIDTAHIEAGKNKIFAEKINYDKKAETATLYFEKPLPARETKLVLSFRGILNDKMRGFYRSRYHIDGKEYHMATTQFEATDARRAFPCFDEPSQKAVFHVALIVPKGKTAISNTVPISVEEHRAGFEIVKFSPTPKMSTYLLAFIVGDLEYIEARTRAGVTIRVYTTIGKKHQAKFALDCAVKTLEFYEEYFAIKYPMPSLDMIAIPDFASGAMENWGAITYRESALLVDENLSSTSNKQWVALVVAHELAHQWFGNLVTMEWWTHLWLNEGFASYIEYLAVNKLFPKWDIWTQFSTNDLGVALRLDALRSTHPIEVEVHHPDEIGEIFDEVSYSKGASVIRMLAEYLGEKDFRDGLRYYLKKHSYQNTETLHLWQAFERVSGKPVAKMMSVWTGKPGYPILNASLSGKKLALSQGRFFSSPISKARSKDKTTWPVPVLIGSKEKTYEIFMNTKKLVSKDDIALENSWLKINIGESGFYRTSYDETLLQKLSAPVQSKALSARDRLGIVRDLFALGEAGARPSTDALSFISSYKNEESYTVWLEIASGLARFEQILAKTKSTDKLDALTRDLFSPVALRLGWDKNKNETHADTLLRSLAIARAGRAGDKKIIDAARKKFADIQKGKNVSPDIRGAIYSIVATWGGKKEYEALVKMYQKETLHEEKNRIGSALGDFQDPKILEAACEFAMGKHVRIQDTVGVLSSVGANPFGRDIWWSFIKKNWKTLVSRYGEGGLTLGRAVKAISGSAEEKHLKSFSEFFKTHQAPGGKRSVEQVIERMESNIAWLKRDGKEIENFLNLTI